MTLRDKTKKGSLLKTSFCRIPLQIIEQVYSGFTENTRLYRVFSYQSDKGSIDNILEIPLRIAPKGDLT